jgi:hypothetical protein
VYLEKFSMDENKNKLWNFNWTLDEKEDEDMLEKEKAYYVWVKNVLHVILMDRGALDRKR